MRAISCERNQNGRFPEAFSRPNSVPAWGSPEYRSSPGYVGAPAWAWPGRPPYWIHQTSPQSCGCGFSFQSGGVLALSPSVLAAAVQGDDEYTPADEAYDP